MQICVKSYGYFSTAKLAQNGKNWLKNAVIWPLWVFFFTKKVQISHESSKLPYETLSLLGLPPRKTLFRSYKCFFYDINGPKKD